MEWMKVIGCGYPEKNEKTVYVTERKLFIHLNDHSKADQSKSSEESSKQEQSIQLLNVNPKDLLSKKAEELTIEEIRLLMSEYRRLLELTEQKSGD